MKIENSMIFKLFVIAIIFTLITLSPINTYTNMISAIGVLLVSIYLLFKSRKNILFTIMFMFILYVNYSFTMGEYIVGGELSVPFYEVKTQEIYGLTIRIILLFMTVITVLYNGKSIELSKIKLEPKDNLIVFYLIISALVFSLITGVDRGDFNSYSVRISPIFEYSKLLFLFAYYFSGKSKIRITIFTLLIGIFILQDLYYGGRITSLQLMILFSITLLVNKLSFKKIFIFAAIGILLNSIVAAYRDSYSLTHVNLKQLIGNLFNNYLVFDTATFAYYASATHVAASEIANISTRFNSFYEFFKSILIGSDSIASDVTTFVSIKYFYNMGGGLIPTHFYFWFGWFGVLIISFIVVTLLNNLNFGRSEFQKILVYSIIFNVPRWYLYSPNQLFKGALFFVTILWIIFWITNSITTKIKSKAVNL